MSGEQPFKIKKIKRDGYDALITKEANTLYIVIQDAQLPRFYFGEHLVSGLAPSELENILSRIGVAESDIDHIEDGTTIVKKAEQDQDGQTIKTTYIKNIELEYVQAENKVNLIRVFGDNSKSLPISFTIPEASTLGDGLLTKEDKVKIDNIASDIAAMGATKVSTSTKNQINGYAGLDANTKVPLALLYDSVLGQMEYAGVFNAATGSFPTMTNALSPNDRAIRKGDYFIANSNGTVGGISFNIGDWLIRNSSDWSKIDNTDAVASVNGKLGVVEIDGTDIKMGDGDTFTIQQRIISIFADINARYTKAETYSQNEIEQRITDLLGIFYQDIELKPIDVAEEVGEAFNSRQIILSSSILELQDQVGPEFITSSPALLNTTFAAQDLAFSEDGLSVFVIDSTTDSINQYSLLTPFDVSTLNTTPIATRSVIETNPYGLVFKPDGTSLYYIGSTNRKIYQCDLLTPWDLSTAQAEKESPLLTSGTYQSLFFSSNGSKVYILNSTTDVVQIHTLWSAWQITSLSTTMSANFNVTSQETTPTGIYISPDGLKLFMVGSSSDKVFEYNLSQAWGNSATFTGNSITVKQNVTNGITFSPDGLIMFLVGSTTKQIDAYSIPFAFSLGTDANEKETKEKFKLKVKPVAETTDAALELTYNKDDQPSTVILKVSKDGTIKDGTNDNLVGTQLNGVQKEFVYANGEIVVNQSKRTTKLNGAEAIVKTKNVSWDTLVSLRDTSNLIPGQQYRITDFVTTTVQENTQSAGHQFDIIVTADSEDKLNENARACLHEGDPYFANSKLEAWQVWYSLDNDTSRFAWADEVGGKGVIYRMIDEFNNDVPYDFKNIQYQIRPGFIYNQWGEKYPFTRVSSLDMVIGSVTYYGYASSTVPSAWSDNRCWVTDDPVNPGSILYTQDGTEISYGGYIGTILTESYEIYTFSKTKVTAENFDVSLNGLLYSCYDNTIRPYVVGQAQGLNRTTFVGWDTNNIPGLYCYGNVFGNNCTGNTFDAGCHSNTFGSNCSNNTFTKSCHSNTFDAECSSNTFDDSCYGNVFGYNCTKNTFAKWCNSNNFGAGCYSNIFGEGSSENTLGQECSSNTFGTSCTHNTFGQGCYMNVFANNCRFTTFGILCTNNTFGADCYYNFFGNNCSYNTLGIACNSNTFSGSCANNFFNYSCSHNFFGNNCAYNFFMSQNSYNTFGNNCAFIQTTGALIQYVNVDGGIRGASAANSLNIYDVAIQNKTFAVNFKRALSGRYLMLWATDTGTMTGKYKATNTAATWTAL